MFKLDTFRRKINFSIYSIYANIRELPRGGQLCIPGNVVNVPADVNSTASTLPRSIDESQTIPIKLKGRLDCKHHYQFQNVRPRKLLEAAKYLVKTSELFQNDHTKVQENWLHNPDSRGNDILANQSDKWKELLTNSYSSLDNSKIHSNLSEITFSEPTQGHDYYAEQLVTDCNGDDGWCEMEERTSGVTDNLLQEPDMTKNVKKVITFAPGEGNKPLGIFMDKDSEFLSFPTIYCGKTQPGNKGRTTPVHYSTI